ncbi:MAG TPA: acyltransferase [Rhodoblastus sp.]|nr:acyltransferase [Rhodoblastus sp.]
MSATLEAGAALGRKPAARSSAGGRIEFANTLRGLAAFAVIVGHLGSIYWFMGPMVDVLTGVPYVPYKAPILPSLIDLGWLGPFGVALFFTISGFVIPFSLEQYSVKGFVAGRLWRIWPTCWAGLSVTVAAVLLGVHFMGGQVPFTFRDAASQYFPPFAAIADARRIDSVMWTLEIEMMFYGVCALAANHLREGRRTLWLFPVGVFLFWVAVDQTVAHFHDHPGVVRRLASFDTDPVFIVFMFCGVALNLLQRGKLTIAQTAGAMALCFALFSLAQYIGHMPFTTDLRYYAAGLAVFILAMRFQASFRRTRVTKFLSDISYPLYVVHGVAGYIVLHALMRLHVNADLAILVTIAFALTVAYVIHSFVELPTHRIGQKIARRLSA